MGDRLVDQLAEGTLLWSGERFERLAEGQAADLLGIQVPTDVGAQHAAPLQGGFKSFAGGMADFVEALVASLGSAVRTNQGVTALAPAARGWRLAVTGGAAHPAGGGGFPGPAGGNAGVPPPPGGAGRGG